MDQVNDSIGFPKDDTTDSNLRCCNNRDDYIHLLFKGIRIWSVKHRADMERYFRIPSSKAVIQMVFNIDEDHHAKGSDSTPFGFHYLFFIPTNCSNHLFEELSIQDDAIAVNVDAALLYDLLPKDNILLHALNKKIDADHATMLSPESLPLTLDMKEIIHQILSCLRKDDCRCLFFHAKVVELLSLQLEQLENMAYVEGSLQNHGLKMDELKRIYSVKEILEQNPQKKFSLLGLAHAVGTNEASLKKQFKTVFGMSVFNYLTAYRMEQARKLLLQGDHKVSSIAYHFGYKHTTHFSAAFKKYFGFPPTGLK